MAYFLFIDESGHDRRASPYEVLAGVSVKDTHLWKLINELHEAEIKHFGGRYSDGSKELRGKKILKAKVFQHLMLSSNVPNEKVAELARSALDAGGTATAVELKALAIAKTRYVEEVLKICAKYRCYIFASVVETDAKASSTGGLRKDYAYVFERFYYYLDAQDPKEQGIIVFDEIEKSQSHILINQCTEYFKKSATGKSRARLVIPEPFFVHSELTTGIQLADLASYIISWGFRTPQMNKPARAELDTFARQISDLRYKAMSKKDGKPFYVWSIAHITDLRTKKEKERE